MLHLLLTEENSELKNRSFPIPKEVRKMLQSTLNNYNGDKTVDGYKRLNNILSMNNISYHEMKRIKNFFDNYVGTDKSAEFILNGGEPMKNWVNATLNQATKAVHDFKQAKKDAGVSNSFIKPHEKDRQNHKKNKPTQVKFNVSNKNMLNNTTLTYESKNKTICITEDQSKMLKEAMDDTFDLGTLSSLKSFNQRVKYCQKHIGKNIGRGSSRMTFQLDDEKVLKLAWNEKGIAQNEEEERAYGDDIFPKIFDSDINSTWLISEFVLPAKAQDFKYCFGMTFQEFVSFIYACGGYRFQKRNLICAAMEEEKWLNLLETNEDLAAFDDYIGNYGSIVVGDMVRLCNYGLTQRNGEPHIVLLDSGLTEYVWDNYYRRR
jgi:hypothetical protein